jgi:hypothetical protein
MKDFVNSGEVRSTVPEGATFVAAGNFNLEMKTGYWMQTTMSIERAGMKMYQDALIYQLPFRGKWIGVQCFVGGQEDEATRVDETFERIRPLCQQVLNSLVLTQAY